MSVSNFNPLTNDLNSSPEKIKEPEPIRLKEDDKVQEAAHEPLKKAGEELKHSSEKSTEKTLAASAKETSKKMTKKGRFSLLSCYGK